jgi:cytochrome c peroxidase
MRKIFVLSIVSFLIVTLIMSFTKSDDREIYLTEYLSRLDKLKQAETSLLNAIEASDINTKKGVEKIREEINHARQYMKGIDFWFRYLDANLYRKINGPLPVEWETEVFEKYEKPYKREGAGLSLAALYTEEEVIEKDSLKQLIKSSLQAINEYAADSITQRIASYSHFYLCNRLFLLNLASIYTTGFECPDTSNIIPELLVLMTDTEKIYQSFNQSFPDRALGEKYLSLYTNAIAFVKAQPRNFSNFDHFSFIKNFVNPLFGYNQQAIQQYRVISRNTMDYSLNNGNVSIFSKNLYNGLNPKGIFLRVSDEKALAEIENAGRLLFYDPVLSGNNKRSCASCHKPAEYFTDTINTASLRYDRLSFLTRNSPSLINSIYNQLAMLDGHHISLKDQARAVITNPDELGSDEQSVVEKVLSCTEYKKMFKKMLRYTPLEKNITFDHITSAIILYYSKFSRYTSPFDDAMNTNNGLPAGAKQGFNLFMSKAECATCHFVPQFNGVKPPFISSEFEVLGVPADTTFKQLSPDKGRFGENPAKETMNAFRTGSLRNAAHTGPYMHNGVFKTINEVLDFYDAGGGVGKRLTVNNQTLSADSLHLTKEEKGYIIEFIKSLNENILFEAPPSKLPRSSVHKLNNRKVGGEY